MTRLEDIISEFSSHGCILLEDRYTNNKTKMRFICSCGEEGFKCLSKFRLKPKCKKCGYADTGRKNGRFSLEEVKNFFERHGAKLLATEYINNSTKMPYLCACGNLDETTLAQFKKIHKCGKCNNRIKWTFSLVSSYFESVGCKLLETKYVNMNTTMQYICSCGNESKTTFANFYHKNVRCKQCGIEKISGENAYQWKPEKTEEERLRGRKFKEYRLWRTSVFVRDDYMCQKCGVRGGTLNAHHLDDWENHPEKRLELDNGVTLCKQCHYNFHFLYGFRTKTTASQFNEYLENLHG